MKVTINNKIDRFIASGEILDTDKMKEFQREYEKLIIDKENHLNIDYFISTEDNQKKFEKKIKYKEKLIYGLVAIYPIKYIQIGTLH